MKRLLTILGIIAIFTCACLVYAADLPTNAVLVIPDPPTASDVAAQLAAQYPIVATILACIGALRILVKPIVAAAHAVAEATHTPKDDEFVAKVESSPTLKTFLFVLDWLASVKFRR